MLNWTPGFSADRGVGNLLSVYRFGGPSWLWRGHVGRRCNMGGTS